jgi:hypothetical protein
MPKETIKLTPEAAFDIVWRNVTDLITLRNTVAAATRGGYKSYDELKDALFTRNLKFSQLITQKESTP